MTLRGWWLSVALVCAIATTAAVQLISILRRDDGGAVRAAPGTWLPVAERRVIPIVSPETAQPRPTARPDHLVANSVAIPVQHVRAPVIDYCPIIDGGLEPPTDVHEVCYWAGGADIGADAGTTVLTGHINWAGVTGAFGNLAALRRGDTVATADADGVVAEWRIVRVEHRPKTQGIDPAAFVGPDGPRRLYLISCGGAFDSSAASYVDNIYVLAEPGAPATPAPPPRPRPVE